MSRGRKFCGRTFSKQQGMVLLFTLLTLVLITLLGTTLMKSALFQERLTTNNRLDALTFNAAESVITASISAVSESTTLREQAMSGLVLESCLKAQGISLSQCDSPGFPLSAAPVSAGNSPAALVSTAQTRFLGTVPLPGFDVDQMVYQRFATEGKAYYPESLPQPFGHLNLQVWQFAGPGTGVFNQ